MGTAVGDAQVDVQVGPHLYESWPQELRSRLWVALLADAAPACNCCSKSALSKGKEKDCDGSCGPRGAGFAEPSALAEPLA